MAVTYSTCACMIMGSNIRFKVSFNLFAFLNYKLAMPVLHRFCKALYQVGLNFLFENESIE